MKSPAYTIFDDDKFHPFHLTAKKNMEFTTQIAKHFNEVYFGGNWTDVNLKKSLSDVTWQEATIKISSLNTIAVLVYHINYYVKAVLNVLQGNPLDAHDKYSFDSPAITSKEDWDQLLDECWNNAEKMNERITQLTDDKLREDFSDNKFGNYYRNINGLIEHTHYHLGQIVLIKKLIRESEKNKKTFN